MPSWQGRSKANTLGYKIFVGLIRVAGLRLCYLFLHPVAFYYFIFSRSSSKPVWYFYRHRMNFGRLKSISYLYKNYYRFGQTLIDKIALMAGIKTDFSFEFDGEENLHRMAAQGSGGILLSAHVGNWEAAGHMLKRLNTRIHIVMYDGEDEKIKEYLNKVTGEKKFNVIYVRNDLSHIYSISQALANKEIVCMHADRFLEGHKTADALFLGEPARFPEGPFLLSLKLKVPVAFVHSFKAGFAHYHFYSTELKYFYPEKGDTVQGVLKQFVLDLEEKIRLYPEQWFNYYNFWQQH